MVTLEQAKEYLESQGITIPDFVLQALVDQANSIQECLDAHYPTSTALLIQLYLLALMGLGQGDKYISSQTAPSGASRSFRYQSFTLIAGRPRLTCCAGWISTVVQPPLFLPTLLPPQHSLVSGSARAAVCAGVSDDVQISD